MISFDSPVGTEEQRASKVIYPGPWISSNPFENKYELGYHTGDDLLLVSGNCANLPFYSIGDGKVIAAYHVPTGTWGNLIVIQHKLDDGSFGYSRYGHSSKMEVQKGDKVVKGQEIGLIGNSDGKFVYHLHFDISTTGVLLKNPADWPGLALSYLAANYVNPRLWLNAHHQGTDIKPTLDDAPVQGTVVHVSTDALKLRANPSTGGLQLSLFYRTTQMVVRGLPVQSNGYDWLPVSTPAGDGWCAWRKSDKSDVYLEVTKPDDIVPEITRYVTAKPSLLVRSRPEKAANDIVGQLPYAAEVVVGEDDPANTVNGYEKILEGPFAGDWVAEQYLQAGKVDPVVVVPPVGPKGFGPHLLGNAPMPGKSYPVFKAMDNPGAVAAAHQANPGGMFIHRRYNKEVDNPDKWVADNGGAKAAAQKWFDMYKGDFEQLPYAYHEGPCEATVTDALIAFEIERVKLLASKGWKACVLNLGVGHTNDDLWKRQDMQQLVSLVQSNNGAVGLHCYGQGVMSASTGQNYWQKNGKFIGEVFPKTIDPSQSWLALRIVRDQQVLDDLGLNPQLIATELGIDDCSNDDQSNGIYWPRGQRTRGWRTCFDVWNQEGWLAGTDPSAFYLKQLQWWVDITGLPGCVYAHGDQTAPVNGGHGCFDTIDLL